MSSTSKSQIKYSDFKTLIPSTTTSFNFRNKLRGFNLNTSQSGNNSLSDFRDKFPFPTINAPVSSMMVCYSIRKVVYSYTGAVFRLRRSSDNDLKNFYTDNKQTYLTTGANNTGTAFATWIGANTAYVVVWYDQSPNANNASNINNNTTQPIIVNVNNKYILSFVNTSLTNLIITTPIVPYTFFSNLSLFSQYNSYVIGSTTSAITQRFPYGLYNGNSSRNVDWFYTAGGTKLSYANDRTPTAVLSIEQFYGVTLSVTTAVTAYSFNKIGGDNSSTSTNSFNGYITDLILHNKGILQSDMYAYYDNCLFNYVFPSTNAPISSMLIAYSVKIINPYYTGPVFQLRRNSDSALQDFYTDRYQTYLSTKINNKGIPFVTWIGSSTAYIRIWYDQSGNQNNARNTTNNTVQPNISFQNGKYVVFFKSAYANKLTLTNSILTTQLNTIFIHFNNTNVNYATIFSTNTALTQNFGSGGTTVNGGSISTNDWYYGSSGTKLSYNNNSSTTSVSLNGWNLLTLSVETPINSGSWTTIGYNNLTPSYSLNGYVTDFICHNKTINTNDITLYNTTNIFNSIFPTTNVPSSSFMGCYSVRLVVSTYIGAIFRLRRSSDNLLQDFYTDSTQSYLTTGANNSGTDFKTWIGTSTAYVYTWYDQSTNARHATNTTNNTTQPNISFQRNKYVVQFQNANSTKLTMPTGIIPYTIFSHFYNTNTSYGTITSTRYSETFLRFGGAGAIFINGDGNVSQDWYNGLSGTKIGYNNGSDSLTVLVGSWNLLSLSGTTLGQYTNTTSFYLIGADNHSNVRSINGYMSEIIFINKAVTTDDMIQYYKLRLF